MGALAILILGVALATGLWVWLAGRPASHGTDVLGLRPARQIVEEREALEAEDLAQLLEASNARRRRRGKPERTLEEVELLVAADLSEQQRRREAAPEPPDLDEGSGWRAT